MPVQRKLAAGLLIGLAVPQAFAASIILDDGFDGPTATYVYGTAPSGWAQLVRNATPGYTTLTMHDGFLHFANSISNTIQPTFISSAALFNATGTTVTTKTDISSLSGGSSGTVFGTSGPAGNSFGWSLSASGQFQVSAQVNGIPACGSGPARCIYVLPTLMTQLDSSPYTGGPVAVTLTANSAGWRLTTNTGFDSGVQSFSLLNPGLPPTFANFENAGGRVILGAIYAGVQVDYGRVQAFTATPGDTQTYNAPTTQSATVATSTLSVTTGGSVSQTGGTTTVLETMTVAAGATYELSGGTLQVSRIVVDPGGTFTLNGGTLAADEVQGNITNTQGGTVSPGNSPGLTEILGNYTQDNTGSLLIEIAGTNPGSEHDQLDISGNAFLGGVLNVDLLYGYVPSAGDAFDILTAKTIVGTFDSVLLSTLPPGMSWQLQYLSDAFGGGTDDVVRLTAVVPMPGAMWLMGSALGLLNLIRRKSVS